jgi:hypothetical protein
MAKTIKPDLLDHLGRPIKIGDPVAFFHRGHKSMKTGRVTKLSKVNVGISWMMKNYEDYRSVRASDVVILEVDAYAFHGLRKDLI